MTTAQTSTSSKTTSTAPSSQKAKNPAKPDPPKAPSTPPQDRPAYTAADIASDLGLASASVVRRHLRAAAFNKPGGGWSWPSRESAKDALAAAKAASEAESKRKG